MTYTTKAFKKRNFFVIYDENDNFIQYFDNAEELKKSYKRELKKIVYDLKKTKDFIKITIDKKEYKLYTYCDN